MDLDNVFNLDCFEGLKMLDADFVDFIVTDPPYDVDYGKKSEYLSKLDKSREKQIERDKHFKDSFVDYDLISQEWFRVLKNNSHIYIFCGDKQIPKWTESMMKAGFKAPQILVWLKNKTTFDMTFGHKFPENKEFILFFQKGWKKLNGYDVERNMFRSVLSFDSSSDTDIHSCAKPLNLLMFLTKCSSKEGDVCLDCFSGSGNHLLAFKRLNRRFIGFEISQAYYDNIKKRLDFDKKQIQLFNFMEVKTDETVRTD